MEFVYDICTKSSGFIESILFSLLFSLSSILLSQLSHSSVATATIIFHSLVITIVTLHFSILIPLFDTLWYIAVITFTLPSSYCYSSWWLLLLI
jgi:hypothetical protein